MEKLERNSAELGFNEGIRPFSLVSQEELGDEEKVRIPIPMTFRGIGTVLFEAISDIPQNVFSAHAETPYRVQVRIDPSPNNAKLASALRLRVQLPNKTVLFSRPPEQEPRDNLDGSKVVFRKFFQAEWEKDWAKIANPLIIDMVELRYTEFEFL